MSKNKNYYESLFKDDKENIFRYYGLYGIKEDGTPNYRTQYKDNSNSNPYVYKREFSYIHEKYPNILEHLKEYYDENNIKHYNKIKTFQFVPYTTNTEDNHIIQSLINESYLHELVVDDMIPFSGLHITREMNFRGYGFNISKDYIDIYREKVKEILLKKYDIDIDIIFTDKFNLCTLDKLLYNKYGDTHNEIEILKKKRIKELIKGYFRTCENIENVKGLETNLQPTKDKLLLQDLLNKSNEKQLLLGSSNITKHYANISSILISPWYNRGLDMGVFSWNLSINKAMISCFLQNTLSWLFPIRLLFEYHPKHLSFDNVDMMGEEQKKKLEYLGFFIIRYNNVIKRVKDNVDKECLGFYHNKNDKLPDLKNIHDQYLVLFVFKDNNLNNILKYKIVNFRLNFVEWGNFAEWKRIFFPELIQVMCYNLSNKIKYYALLKKNKDDSLKELNEICNNQFENDSTKKNIMQCFESYFFPDTFKKIKELKCYPYSDIKCLHVLISSKDEHEIIELIKQIKGYEITIINKEYINILEISSGDEYILFPCFLKWDKNNFGLCHGKLNLDKSTLLFYRTELCIDNKCILERDIPKNNMLNNIYHFKNDEDKDYFEINNITFTKNYLLSFFPPLDIKKIPDKTIEYTESKTINKYQDNIYILAKIKLNDENIYKLKKQLEKQYNSKIQQNINKIENNNKILKFLLENKPLEQSGGNKVIVDNNCNCNIYINKFLKSADKYYILHNNFISIINTYDKNKINNYIKDITFYINSHKVYNNITIEKNIYNKIVQNIPSFISTLYYLVLPNILIISKNINFTDIIISIINNVNIVLILFNYDEKDKNNLIKLKKFKNITIHIINNKKINYFFYKKIKKIIGDTKYSSIIIDPGTNRENNYQEYFICISLLLSNKNLILNGTFINYCLMPYLNDNYLYLLYLLKNNFNLNYINQVGSFNINDKSSTKLYKYITNINISFKKIKFNKNIKFFFKDIILDIKNNIIIDNDYLIYLDIKWKEFYINNKIYYQNIFKINYINN